MLLLSLLLLVSSSTALRTTQHHGPRGGVRNSNNHQQDDNDITVRRNLKSKKSKKGKKGPKKRECKVSEKRNDVKFKCKSKTDKKEDIQIKDEIEFGVKTSDDGLKVKIKYEQEIKNDDDKTESETQYELTFDRIIEYKKANVEESEDDSEDNSNTTTTKEQQAQAYDWEEDSVVQTVDLSDWNRFSSIVDEGVTSTFSVASTDDSVQFTFTISRDEIADTKLTANKMKIDFELMDFRWKRNDTYVALLSSVESKQSIQEEEDDSNNLVDVKISFDEAVNTIGFTPTGEYTWDTVAEATNRTSGESSRIAVVATSPARSSAVERIAFSFVGEAARSSEDIYWDPEAGVAYDDSGSSIRRASVVSAVAIALMALFL